MNKLPLFSIAYGNHIEITHSARVRRFCSKILRERSESRCWLDERK